MVSDWYSYPGNYSINKSVDGIGSFMQYISLTTNNWLATGFLFLIWLFSFGIGMVSGSRKALLVSSFITFLFSIYFVRLNLINPMIVIAIIIMMLIGAITSFNEMSL